MIKIAATLAATLWSCSPVTTTFAPADDNSPSDCVADNTCYQPPSDCVADNTCYVPPSDCVADNTCPPPAPSDCVADNTCYEP